MFKRIIALLTVFGAVFAFNLTVYAKAEVKPGLSFNGSEAVLSLEGKSEHVYIIRFVLNYNSATAGIAKISADDGSTVRCNSQRNKVTVLYFNKDGASLDGRKNYIYFDFTNGSYGDFYVTKCELVESNDKLSVLDCNERITVAESKPIESGYRNRMKQGDSSDYDLNINTYTSSPVIDEAPNGDTPGDLVDISEKEYSLSNTKGIEADYLAIIIILIFLLILLSVGFICFAYKSGKRYGMMQNTEKQGEDNDVSTENKKNTLKCIKEL